MDKALSALVLTLALLANTAFAELYAYRTTGQHGEVMFSDIPTENAKSIELQESNTPSPSSAQQVQMMLAVANDLAAARVTREAQRAARRKQAQQAQKDRQDAYKQSHAEQLEREYQRRNYYPYAPYYSPGYAHRPHPGSRPPRHEPGRETQSIRFELK